ncbi:hypothetical protein NQ315_014383 [Exocentrus adspersus]|uniref:Uncharacterized protein n=1 Tax=Exocentrus adspersus TaxID=1586481 RepID=A0AAV8V6J9_9CUCU|nr:hypothetical protein NQ315_014383 [Exocentrus adspersus]
MAGRVVHQALANTYKLVKDESPYYKYTPTTIPDIVFQDKKKKITYLIDISIPNDSNIQAKYNEKIAKYTDLAIEMQRLWNQARVEIIPLVMSTTGLTPHTFYTDLK